MIALLLPSLLLPALAADPTTFDAHGFVLAPQDVGPSAGLVLTRPGAFDAGALSLGAVFEYAHAPLVARRYAGDELVFRDERLSDLFVMNTRAGYAPNRWLRLGAAVPVIFAADGPEEVGGTLGDVRVDATLVLARRDEGDWGRVHVGVTPFLDLPTGPTEALLGSPGIAGGATASATWDVGALALGGEAGIGFAPTVAYENLTGGDRLLLAGSVGARVTDAVGLTLEAVARPKVKAGNGGDAPAELILSTRATREDGAWYTAGVATAASGGAGAADVRLFLGGGWGSGAATAPADRDGDGVIDADDACPDEAGVPDGKDGHGCPVKIAPARLTVPVSFEGRQVSGARLELSDGATTVALSTGTEPWVGGSAEGATWTARATLGPCLAGERTATLAAGDNELPVVLQATRAASVVVEVKDADGNRLPGATVRWTGGPDGCAPSGESPSATRVAVGPGAWRAVVSAAGYRDGGAEVTLAAGDDKVVEVTLQRTRIKVETERIQILESVFFDTGKATLQARSYPLLDEIAGVLVATPSIAKVEIRGHTDGDGSEAANLDLSQRRAEAVRAYLVSKGVAADRLVAKGFGEGQPIDTNMTATGRARNRRVEFAIVERR